VSKFEKGIEIPVAPKVEEEFYPNLPLIPFSVFSPAITFLRDVKAEKKTEGLVRFYFHDGKWSAHVPEQTVGAAEVEVEEGLEEPPGLFAAEIHSHPGSSAFPSGVDDTNEQVDRMYMIVAFPDKKVPVFTARIGTGMPVWFVTDVNEFVSVEDQVNWKTRAASFFMSGGDTLRYIAYPKEWMEKIKEQPRNVVIRARYTPMKNGRFVERLPHGGYRTLSKEEKEKQEKMEEELIHDKEVSDWLKEHGHFFGLTVEDFQ